MKVAGSAPTPKAKHALVSDAMHELGGQETTPEIASITFDEFEDCVRECQVSVQERRFKEACEQLRVIQNQIALNTQSGQQNAGMFLVSSLHLRLFDWLDDPKMQILCPYIVLIFTDLLDKCGTHFFERCIYNDVLEKLMHIWNTYPYLHEDTSLLCYNLYSYAHLSRENSSYFAGRISEMARESVVSDSEMSFWVPFALVSIMRSERLVSREMNRKFVDNIVQAVEFTNSLEVRRACFWSVYFWFKNGIVRARDLDTDEELPTADQFLTKGFMIMISNMLMCDDFDILSIALYLHSWMWHLPSLESRKRVLRHLKMQEIFEPIATLAQSDNSLLSSYAFLVLENFSDYDQERCMMVTHQPGTIPLIDSTLSEGTTNQKIAASWLLCRLLLRGTTSDITEIVTPERLSALIEQFGSDHDLSCIICDALHMLLPRLDWVCDFLLSENFDQTLLDCSDQSDPDFDTSLYECLQHHRQKITP